ncbi:MAG: hypothetical protein K6L81_08965 [Agarilytica sp.]
MIKKLFTLVALLSSTYTFAYVDCPKAKVKHIQPDVGWVYIQLEGQDWQRLGDYDEKSLSSKVSIALSAFASGKEVMLRFPDGHNSECTSFNNTVNAWAIRISED